MRLVSPLLKRVVYPALSQTGYLRRFAEGGSLCVVTYHGVRPVGYVSSDPMLDGSLVSAVHLRAQLRLLKTRYRVIEPAHFLAWLQGEQSLPSLAILLTCDDGLQNVLTDMVPILQDEGVRCLFFVTGASAGKTEVMLWYEQLYLALKAAPGGPITIDNVGIEAACDENSDRRAFWWQLVQELSASDPQARTSILEELYEKLGFGNEQIERLRANSSTLRRFFLLTLPGLQQLVGQGMSIGAHTLHHPLLARATDTCARAEIVQSRTALTDTLGREIWAFAYPFGNAGSFTARDVALAEAAQFQCAFTNVGGGFGANLPRFTLPRVHVTADMNLGEFEAQISGFCRTLRGARPLAVGAGGWTAA